MDEKSIQKIENLFVTALNKNVFSGASFSFARWTGDDYSRVINCYGYAERKPELKDLTIDHIFDLASLTKPLATVPLLLHLLEKKRIGLETELSEIFSFCPNDKRKITIQQIMSHSAGFPPHKEYFTSLNEITKNGKKSFLLQTILNERLLSKPGEKHQYSDLGFMLLGFIIETITAKDLDELASSIIYAPLGLQNDLLFPGLTKKRSMPYVSTEKCMWSKKMLCGTVHDDNCRAMGGVAGHAGLFGTIRGVSYFCGQLLNQWQGREHHPAYSNTIVNKVLKRVGRSTWTLGFDMVSAKDSSSGKYFSDESIGHLGFTGTSFWIDPKKDCIAVLLSNRVHPSRDNWAIKEFRPVFHNMLMESI